MKKYHVILDFTKLNVPGKIAFGRNVVQNMSALRVFAQPDVPYADVTGSH